MNTNTGPSGKALNFNFEDKGKTLRAVLFSGAAIFLTVSPVALLHANEAEFILDRFEGISTLAFSLFDSVVYAAYLIFGPIAGWLAAKTGKRKFLVLAGTLGLSVTTLLMPLAGVYPLLLALRFLQGIFCVSAWLTLMTLILDLSDSGNRGRNMGIFGLFMSLAMGLSPMLGGVLAGVSVFAPYYSGGALAAAAAIITAFLLPDLEIKLENLRPSLGKALSYVRERPKLVVPGIFNLVDRLHMGFIIFMIPLMLRQLLNMGPEYRGMLLGINGLPFILLQYPIGRLSDRVGRYKLLVTGSVGYGVLLCTVGFAAGWGFPFLIAVFFLLGIFSGLTGPPNSALVGDLVPKGENPLAMAFFGFLGNAGMVIGSLLGGFMLTVGSFTLAFIVAGLIELVTLGINIFLIRHWRISGE